MERIRSLWLVEEVAVLMIMLVLMHQQAYTGQRDAVVVAKRMQVTKV